MPLTAPRYLYKLQDDDTTYEVTVYPADQTVAEQTAARMLMGSIREVPLTTTMLWCWAAGRRVGHHTLEWPAFHAALEAVEPPEDQHPDADLPELDPTRPGSTA